MDFKKWKFSSRKAKRVISGDVALEIGGSGDIFCSLLNQKTHFCNDRHILNHIFSIICFRFVTLFKP